MRANRWIKPCMWAMALLGWGSAWAADSTLLAPDTRIDPVLIVASYSFGPCSQDIAGDFIQRMSQRSLANSDKAKQMPTYLFCRYLPPAMQQRLLAHHFDAVLQEFDTPPLENREYSKRLAAFMQQALNAPENAKRYVLQYNGTLFEHNLHSFTTVALLSPADAEGKRSTLGSFELDVAQLYDYVGGGSMGVPATYRLRSPGMVAELIANSMESRCVEKALLFGKKECPQRLHLTAPGR